MIVAFRLFFGATVAWFRFKFCQCPVTLADFFTFVLAPMGIRYRYEIRTKVNNVSSIWRHEAASRLMVQRDSIITDISLVNMRQTADVFGASGLQLRLD